MTTPVSGTTAKGTGTRDGDGIGSQRDRQALQRRVATVGDSGRIGKAASLLDGVLLQAAKKAITKGKA